MHIYRRKNDLVIKKLECSMEWWIEVSTKARYICFSSNNLYHHTIPSCIEINIERRYGITMHSDGITKIFTYECVVMQTDNDSEQARILS